MHGRCISQLPLAPSSLETMSIRLIPILALALFLSACASSTPKRLPPTAPRTLVCMDGQYMNLNIYGPDKAVLSYKGRNHSLARTSTGSGVAYKSDDVKVWNKGLEYMIDIGNEHRICHPQPQLLDTAELAF